ncbi:MAG: hypothetical protein MZW92_59220 [Comamonadaceae bacterium]|nr:hypothetical protein [Comamonadaceae bacterium]
MLEFEANGYPTDQTVERIRDEIDYQRAVQAYIHFVPAVAIMQWRNGHVGPLGGKAGDLIVYRTTEQKLPIITANDTTTYVITFAESERHRRSADVRGAARADRWRHQRPLAADRLGYRHGRPGPRQGR